MGMTYKRGAVWWVKYYRNGRPIRESSHSCKESEAINLLKLREGDIAHGLPVNPKLNRIRFDEAAADLKTEYALNGAVRPMSSSDAFGCTCFPTSAVAAFRRSRPPT